MIDHYTRKYYEVPIGPGQHPVPLGIKNIIYKYTTCPLGDFELQTQEERENSPIIQIIGQYENYLLFLVNDKEGVGFKIQKFDIYNHQRSDVFSWLNDFITTSGIAYATYPERNLIALGLNGKNAYVLTKGLESKEEDVIKCYRVDVNLSSEKRVSIKSLAFGKNGNVLFIINDSGDVLRFELTFSKSSDVKSSVIQFRDENEFNINMVLDQQSGNLYYTHSKNKKIGCIYQSDKVYDYIISDYNKHLLSKKDFGDYRRLAIINEKLVTCIIRPFAQKNKLITFDLKQKFIEGSCKNYEIYELPEHIFPQSFFLSSDQKYLMIGSRENIDLFDAGSVNHMKTIQLETEEEGYTFWYENFFVFSDFPKSMPALIVACSYLRGPKCPLGLGKLKKLSLYW